jgi:hypothetical protein
MATKCPDCMHPVAQHGILAVSGNLVCNVPGCQGCWTADPLGAEQTPCTLATFNATQEA